RDHANAWIWRMAEYTREVHEEYAVQRSPETKRLLGLLVNSSGAAHARNARRLVHAARKEDRRLSAALLAAALAHTPEAEEALRGARTRMARKPAALARELLRNFPKGRRGKGRRKQKRSSAAKADAAGRRGLRGDQADQRPGADERRRGPVPRRGAARGLLRESAARPLPGAADPDALQQERGAELRERLPGRARLHPGDRRRAGYRL